MIRVLSNTLELVRRLSAALTSLLCGLAMAAPTNPAVPAEIELLLAQLQTSGRTFNRNNSWYSGAEAIDHLLRKLTYIEGRSTVQSTEQFIELAASKSSSSGKAYRVKCGEEPPLESAAWLTKQLRVIRATGGKGRS